MLPGCRDFQVNSDENTMTRLLLEQSKHFKTVD